LYRGFCSRYWVSIEKEGIQGASMSGAAIPSFNDILLSQGTVYSIKKRLEKSE